MAYKISNSNYIHIRNSVLNRGIAYTAKYFGVDKNTLEIIKGIPDYDSYKEHVAQVAREQYALRLERQRRQAEKNSIRFNGQIELNKNPNDSPFNTSAELGRAKTIVTEVKREEPVIDLKNKEPIMEQNNNVQFKKKSNRGGKRRYPAMTDDIAMEAVKLAKSGMLIGRIAEELGYPSSTVLKYNMSKNNIHKNAFEKALEEGKDVRHNTTEKIRCDNITRGRAEKELKHVEMLTTGEPVPTEEPKTEAMAKPEPKAEKEPEPKAEPKATRELRKFVLQSPEYNIDKDKGELYRAIAGAVRIIAIGILVDLFALAVKIIASGL